MTLKQARTEKSRRCYPHEILPVYRHAEDCLHSIAFNKFSAYTCTCGQAVKVGYTLILK
jgi:hypothetical protein